MTRKILISIARECPYNRDCNLLSTQENAADDDGENDYNADRNGCHDQGYLDCLTYKHKLGMEK